MADRSILYRFRAALQNGFVSVAREVELLATYVGVLTGANDTETALRRIDATGEGSRIRRYTGNFVAQASNIDEWFGGRQLTRLRCTDSNLGPSISGTVTFQLPAEAALNTAFDQLQTLGMEEVIRFIIEYTGPSKDRLSIIPRPSSTPVISGTSSIPVRTGIAATLEVTRNSGTISDYVFQSIGGIAGGDELFDALRFQNPANVVWDASSSGILPTQVAKGNAYKVVNAPTDGSGRFGEVMYNGDWVVWEGETFTAWATEPHQWLVLPAHEVRRISALENDFLTDIQETAAGHRNGVIRGANYADDAGEIRLKIYATAADYDAADLNTTGDIDVYTDTSNQTGRLAIRLTGNLATLQTVLPTLYVYSDDGTTFTRLINLDTDFTHQGNFGSESDYLSIEDISYTANTNLRIFVGSIVERYNSPNFDVYESNLSDAVQAKLNQAAPWYSIAEVLFSGASVRDIHVADRVEYTTGYTRAIDWRDMSESTTVNANRYIDSDLTISVNLAAFTIDGFGANLQKLIGIALQRNDAQTGVGAMIEIAPSVAFVRVNTANEIQINTTPGSGSVNWASLSTGFGNITLASGSNNFLVFEVVPRVGVTNGYELIADFYNGTDYHECNNVDFVATGTVTGDNLGFSRSVNQRGQITRFSAINLPGYLTHNQLDSLLRQHQNDKWNFGFARLFEAHTAKEVVFNTNIELLNNLIKQSPNGTRYTIDVEDDGAVKTDEIT